MTILILGSGPNVTEARSWARDPFDKIVAINNAWKVRADWDDAIYPEDFDSSRKPPALIPGQAEVTAAEFVPTQNAYGGFIYGGGTMAFTAGYWVLAHYKPRSIAYFGCDMIYPAASQTHFYGNGTADPLRDDVTLQSLEAKATRLAYFAHRQGCRIANLSQRPSRLVFPRSEPDAPAAGQTLAFDENAAQRALQLEAQLNYEAPCGRYWNKLNMLDPAALRDLDDLWLASINSSQDPLPKTQTEDASRYA